ncbi:hypothetical protein J8TS2_04370 [Lederbergia ruris]|uniref:Uncharacterized protein n=1 Tax=Lederbergia ruris TaxID=217495 RepID=A0ABQ4KDS0_9BACI|nr:hypothetical protein J8TS2_04370 [Lederbergia ruris]
MSRMCNKKQRRRAFLMGGRPSGYREELDQSSNVVVLFILMPLLKVVAYLCKFRQIGK